MTIIEEYKINKAAHTVNTNNFFDKIEILLDSYENYYQQHITKIAEQDAYIKELEARLAQYEEKKEEKNEA